MKSDDLIQDAVEQQLALCQCPQWYPVQKIEEGVYRVCSSSRYSSSTLCSEITPTHVFCYISAENA